MPDFPLECHPHIVLVRHPVCSLHLVTENTTCHWLLHSGHKSCDKSQPITAKCMNMSGSLAESIFKNTGSLIQFYQIYNTTDANELKQIVKELGRYCVNYIFYKFYVHK